MFTHIPDLNYSLPITDTSQLYPNRPELYQNRDSLNAIPVFQEPQLSQLDQPTRSLVDADLLGIASTGTDSTPYFISDRIITAQHFTDDLTGFTPQQPWVGEMAGQSVQSLSTGASSTQIVSGSLRADWFHYNATTRYTIFSGNGNVDFGAGYQDTLDLSWLTSGQVQWNLATNQGGGLLYNPGNGPRVFDALTLSNGNQILFEGMDTIQFADRRINLAVTTTDPLFNQQWNLHMMGVQNSWRFTTGSSQVMVGIQDSGLGTDRNGFFHPDLPTTTVYTNNYQDDFRESFDSHGTGVEGIIGAKTNNGIGMSGINWQSELFQIDVLDGGLTDQSLPAATQNMINQAAQTGKRLVINMSLGIPGSFNQNLHPDLEAVVARNPNVLFVIAAGNDGETGQIGLASPAVLARQYGNVMAIGASWGAQDRSGNFVVPGQRIQYSNWGSQYGPGLTLMGPSEVVSTEAQQNQFGQTEFRYYLTQQRFDGTSAAAPNVAGVASLVLSANPNLTASAVRTILSQTATDLGEAGYDYLYGNGFVNADAAVRQAIAYRYVNSQPIAA